MRSKQCFLSVLYMFLCLTLLSMSVDAKPIQVLLLSGANNHDWRSTTPYLERLCEHYPDIRVTITNCPDTLNTEYACERASDRRVHRAKRARL